RRSFEYASAASVPPEKKSARPGARRSSWNQARLSAADDLQALQQVERLVELVVVLGHDVGRGRRLVLSGLLVRARRGRRGLLGLRFLAFRFDFRPALGV